MLHSVYLELAKQTLVMWKVEASWGILAKCQLCGNTLQWVHLAAFSYNEL